MDLVRVQVEVLYPDCEIVGQTNIPLYLNPPRPFLVWPSSPAWRFGKTMDTIVIQNKTTRFHFQSIGTAMDMITLGNLDFLLTLKSEGQLFGPWLAQFAEKAAWEGDALAQNNYRRFCRIAAFEVSVPGEEIYFAGWLPGNNVLRKVLEAK